MQKIIAQIAQEIRVRPQQVQAAVELLDGGATVPFIARYRKEATDGLDDIQLRELEARQQAARAAAVAAEQSVQRAREAAAASLQADFQRRQIERLALQQYFRQQQLLQARIQYLNRH